MRSSRRALLITCGVLLLGTAVWSVTASIRPPAPLDADPWDAGVGAVAGRDVFASCASCHLADASGRPDGSIPRLAGQRAAILQRKLERLASGEVDLPVMAGFAASLQPAEITAVSTWLAGLPDPAPRDPPAGAGALLYAGSCLPCHGPQAEGQDALGAPRLCGQHAPYLLRRMQDSAQGARADADLAMAAIVRAVPQGDREVIAAWLAAGSCAPMDQR